MPCQGINILVEKALFRYTNTHKLNTLIPFYTPPLSKTNFEFWSFHGVNEEIGRHGIHEIKTLRKNSTGLKYKASSRIIIVQVQSAEKIKGL